jgi:hypothetical protein
VEGFGRRCGDGGLDRLVKRRRQGRGVPEPDCGVLAAARVLPSGENATDQISPS